MGRQRWLVLGILAAAMVTGVAGSWWWGTGQARHALVEQVQDGEYLVADERANQVADAVDSVESNVIVFATSPMLRDALAASDTDQVATLVAVLMQQRGVEGVRVSDATGHTLIQSGARTHGLTAGRLEARGDGRDASILLQAAVPNGLADRLGSVRVRISLAGLLPTFTRPFHGFPGTTTLVDPSGRVFMSNGSVVRRWVQAPEVLALLARGGEGRARYWSAALQAHRIGVVAPVPGHEWSILVGADTAVADVLAASLAKRLIVAAAVGVNAVLVGLALGAWFLIATRRRYRAMHDATLRAAGTDPLTSVANRRAFDDALARLAGRDIDLSFVAVDLDGFKQLNDRYGHPAGDRALQAVASAMHRTVRDTDLVVRLGGDEFVVVLPGVDAVGARDAVHRLRLALREIDDPQFGTPRASVGWASGRSTEARAILAEADTALYVDKRERREALTIL